MTKKEIIELAKSLKLELSEKTIDNILHKHESFAEKLIGLKNIDTNNVEPMHRIDSSETFFMREDIEGDVLPVDTIIDNAPSSSGNFISIEKVVK